MVSGLFWFFFFILRGMKVFWMLVFSRMEIFFFFIFGKCIFCKCGYCFKDFDNFVCFRGIVRFFIVYVGLIVIIWLFWLFNDVILKLIFIFFFLILVLFIVVRESLFSVFLIFSNFIREGLIMVMLDFELIRLYVVIWWLELFIIFIGIIWSSIFEELIIGLIECVEVLYDVFWLVNEFWLILLFWFIVFELIIFFGLWKCNNVWCVCL